MTTPNNTVAGLAVCEPCPFCGSGQDNASEHPFPDAHGYWIARCGNPNCAAEIAGNSPEDATERWNRRASPAPSALAGVERLVAEYAEYFDNSRLAFYTQEFWSRLKALVTTTEDNATPAPAADPLATAGDDLAEQYRKGWEAGRADARNQPEARGVEGDPMYRAGYAQGVEDSRNAECECCRTIPLAAAPSGVRVDEKQALARRAIGLAREMEPWDGKTYNAELTATLKKLAALAGKGGA